LLTVVQVIGVMMRMSETLGSGVGGHVHEEQAPVAGDTSQSSVEQLVRNQPGTSLLVWDEKVKSWERGSLLKGDEMAGCVFKLACTSLTIRFTHTVLPLTLSVIRRTILDA